VRLSQNSDIDNNQLRWCRSYEA